MAPERDPRFATTLARGLSVLRAFRTTDDGLSNAEIAKRTGLPKSTVSRLTWTLGQLGYLVQSGQDERFRPGPTLVALGQVATVSLTALAPAWDMMGELADATGTLVVLAVRDGARMVLIRTWRPRHVASLWLEPGQPLPFRGFSSSRGWLAAASEAEFARLLDEPGLSVPPADLRVIRGPAQAELAARGFVLTPGGPGRPAPYNAASVPLRARGLPEPVVFTCGALEENCTIGRMEDSVGPALSAAVGRLTQMTGQLTPLHHAGDHG